MFPGLKTEVTPISREVWRVAPPVRATRGERSHPRVAGRPSRFSAEGGGGGIDLTPFDSGLKTRAVDVEHDRRHFDCWASRYDRSVLQPVLFSPTHIAALDAAAEFGATPHDVLDLGCGTGRLLERAASKWPEAHLIGVDVSPKMIAAAQAKHVRDCRFRFEVADAAALSLAPDSVDVAFSTISFHHWADQRGGIRQVARVLRPGGLFVLADIRPPMLLRPVLPYFHASRSRQNLFRDGGFAIVAERLPLRLGGGVLITVGRKR